MLKSKRLHSRNAYVAIYKHVPQDRDRCSINVFLCCLFLWFCFILKAQERRQEYYEGKQILPNNLSNIYSLRYPWVNSQVDKLEALRINWSDLKITEDASHSRWQTEHLQVMFLSTQRPFEITKKIFLKLCNHRYKKWKTEFMG